MLDGGLGNESMGQCADLDIVQALQKTKKELLDRRVTGKLLKACDRCYIFLAFS